MTLAEKVEQLKVAIERLEHGPDQITVTIRNADTGEWAAGDLPDDDDPDHVEVYLIRPHHVQEPPEVEERFHVEF